jgi:TolA-binding protein
MISMIDWNARKSVVSMLVVAVLLAGSSTAVSAQDAAGETRLRKIEAEVRALQRQVFPGGDERFFKPEVTTGQAGTASTSSSTSAVNDILTRMDAIEAQLAQLTGQVEENANRIGVLEARAGIVRPTGAPAAAAASAGSTPVAAVAPAPAPATTNVAPPAPVAVAVPAPAPAAATASASRLAAVRAIEKPQTSDPGDDEYSYGFRLWEARFYPEARQQLKLFVDKYPRHRRISWGRNLLGRAYLDDGQPAEAAKWFLENYNADKAGARAPDSLLYLGQSMKTMKDTKRACIALAEFSDTYASEAAGRLKAQFDETRRGLACPG